MENNKIVDWIKAHRTELAIAGVTIVGTVLVVKNLDTIKGLFKNIGLTTPKLVEVEPVIEKVAAPVLSSDILDNLTGNELTARALGDKVWCSAQAINKRIVAAGLAIRLPCGEYQMTEAGRLLGKNTLKTTAAGHAFSNIEWDEKILDIIFSPEELQAIAEKEMRVRQFLSA